MFKYRPANVSSKTKNLLRFEWSRKAPPAGSTRLVSTENRISASKICCSMISAVLLSPEALLASLDVRLKSRLEVLRSTNTSCLAKRDLPRILEVIHCSAVKALQGKRCSISRPCVTESYLNVLFLYQAISICHCIKYISQTSYGKEDISRQGIKYNKYSRL